MLLTLLAALAALASERIELPVEEAHDTEVVPLGENGVVLFAQPRGDRRSYTITGYGPDLDQRWKTKHTFARPRLEIDKTADDVHAWVLLQHGRTLGIMRANLESGFVKDIPIALEERFVPTEMVADGAGGVWIRATRGNLTSLYWVTDGASRLALRQRGIGIRDLAATREGRVQAVITGGAEKGSASMRVVELQNGQVLRRIEVTPREGIKPRSARLLSLEDREIIVGTWTQRRGADGFYVASIEKGVQTSFRTYPFAELDNAFAFLSDPRQEKAERRVEQEAQRGKVARLHWSLLLHDPIPTSEGWMLVAEAFVPHRQLQAHTVRVWDGKGGYTTKTEYKTDFFGWEYSHALAVGFDTAGDRLWDHSIALDRVSYGISEGVRVKEDGGTVTLLYPLDRVMHRAVIRGSNLVREGEKVSIEEAGGESVDANRWTDAVWWHDDVFLAYGVDKRADGEKVFFLSTL